MDHGNQSIDHFLEFVASGNVTPAAGSVNALVCAAGAALLEMVCQHSRSTDRPAEVLAELQDAGDEPGALRRRLLELSEADANAVDALLGVPENRSDSREVTRATGVPLAVAESGLEVLDAGPFVLKHGNQNAVPDGVAGIVLTHAALRASIFIVRTNLEFIDESTFSDEKGERASEMESSAEKAYRNVIENGNPPIE